VLIRITDTPYHLLLLREDGAQVLSKRDERCTHDTVRYDLVMVGFQQEKQNPACERNVPILERHRSVSEDRVTT
jgi:hypothetical protein